jgi:hypothetical protein
MGSTHQAGSIEDKERNLTNVANVTWNRPISVYRLIEMPIQSCGQSVSVPRGKAGIKLNAHTELRAKR